jgi:preprotein translocase subunit YajC
MIEVGDTVITEGDFIGTVTAIRGRTAFVWFDWKGNVNRVEPYKLSTLRFISRGELEAA